VAAALGANSGEDFLAVQWAAPLSLHGGCSAPATSTFRRGWLEAHHASTPGPSAPSDTAATVAAAAAKAAGAAAAAWVPLPAVGSRWASRDALADFDARAAATAPLLWGAHADGGGTAPPQRRAALNGPAVVAAALPYEALVCRNDPAGLVDALGRLRRDG
jgi:hypothetical protein